MKEITACNQEIQTGGWEQLLMTTGTHLNVFQLLENPYYSRWREKKQKKEKVLRISKAKMRSGERYLS